MCYHCAPTYTTKCGKHVAPPFPSFFYLKPKRNLTRIGDAAMYGASARRQRRIISTLGICFGFPQAYEWLKGEKFTLEMQFGSELISRNWCRWGREPSPNAFSEGVQVVKRAFSKPSPKSGVRSVMATGRIRASKGDLFRRGLPNNPHTRSS